MVDSPAYRLYHEEVIKALEEGIAFVENLNPIEAIPDDTLLSLADKSLITTDVSGPEVLYRLLHVTRAYATEKLVEARDFRSLPGKGVAGTVDGHSVALGNAALMADLAVETAPLTARLSALRDEGQVRCRRYLRINRRPSAAFSFVQGIRGSLVARTW